MNIIHVSNIATTPKVRYNFYCASVEAVDALLAQLEKIGCKWGSSHKPTKWTPGVKPPYVIEVHPDARITWRMPLGYESSTTRRVVL
jgi:hypothetical protein